MTLFVAALVLIVDRLTKVWAVGNLRSGGSIEIPLGIFRLTLVLNTGAAFGTFKGGLVFFIALSVSVIAFIIFYILRNRISGISAPLALGLILGGALGNLMDRIWFGYVIDFLDLRVWPVFNIADSAITVGTVILLWDIVRKSAKRKAQN